MGIKFKEVSEYADSLKVLKRTIDATVTLPKPSNYHFTLHFFGEITGEQEEAIVSTFSDFQFSSFILELGKPVSFPPKRKNKTRVLAVSPITGREQLLKLHALVSNQIRKIGFEVEKRPYSPHLTVGRVKKGKQIVELTDRWLAKSFKKEVQEITHMTLFESVLSKTGPIYSSIANFEFSH